MTFVGTVIGERIVYVRYINPPYAGLIRCYEVIWIAGVERPIGYLAIRATVVENHIVAVNEIRPAGLCTLTVQTVLVVGEDIVLEHEVWRIGALADNHAVTRRNVGSRISVMDHSHIIGASHCREDWSNTRFD